MIAVLGEGLIDFIEKRKENELSFTPRVGGSPLNVAVTLARQGRKTVMGGCFSTDFLGGMICSHLRENGVGLDYVRRRGAPSTLAFVGKNEENKPVYAFFTNDSADLNPDEEEFLRIPYDQLDGAVIGSISLGSPKFQKALLRFLKDKPSKVPLSFDPNIRPGLMGDRDEYRELFTNIIRFCDIVKLSDEDLDWIFPGTSSEQVFDRLFSCGAALVAYTKGRDGSRLITAQGVVCDTPLYDLPLVDSVGAGDVFHGSMISYLCHYDLWDSEKLSGLSLEQLLEISRHSNMAAGINCSREGCQPPTWADCEKESLNPSLKIC